MTSTGTSTFSMGMSDIITAGYRKAGIIGRQQVADSLQLDAGRQILNLLCAELANAGNRVWTTERAILFLQKGQNRYSLGVASSDHCSDAFDFANTTLTAAAAAGATALTVDSITGIATGDHLGIELDSGEFQWTTVNGAPSGSTVTATAALTGAAASGNTVVAYTNRIIRPLKVVAASQFAYADANETDVEMTANLDYQSLPSKSGQTSPFVKAFYQPKIPLGIMTAWQTPGDVVYGMTFSYHRPIFDFTSNADTPDLPIEWYNALIYSLAVDLIPNGNVPAERATLLIEAKKQKMMDALTADREPESICFEPDFGADA